MQSKPTHVGLISLSLLPIECASFATISILLSVTSVDVSINFLIFLSYVIWRAALSGFKIENKFSAAFLPFLNALIPSVLNV